MKSTWRATASNIKSDSAASYGPQFAIDSREYYDNHLNEYFHSSTDWDIDVDQIWLQVSQPIKLYLPFKLKVVPFVD